MFLNFVMIYYKNTESVSLFSLVNVGNLSSSEDKQTSSHVMSIMDIGVGLLLIYATRFPTTNQIK